MPLLHICKSCCRCIIVIQLRLRDKRVCVNLRRARNFLTVITSQECLAATQHMPGSLHDIHCVALMCLHVHMSDCTQRQWSQRGQQRCLKISHPLISIPPSLSLCLLLSTLITCFIFLLLPFLQSDILAVIYLSFQISYKSFYLPLSFQPLFFFSKLPPSSSLPAP